MLVYGIYNASILIGGCYEPFVHALDVGGGRSRWEFIRRPSLWRKNDATWTAITCSVFRQNKCQQILFRLLEAKYVLTALQNFPPIH